MTTVKPLDVADSDELDELMLVSAASVAEDPFSLVWSVDEVRAMFEQPSAYTTTKGYVCRDDAGVMVGWGLMDLPLLENSSTASFALGVPPDRRGRGYGGQLAKAMSEDARAAGRTVADANASWPGDAETSPARRFAERHGLTLRNTSLHQVLDQPIDDDLLESLATSAARHHSGYRMVTWTGACPPALIDQYCSIRARMNLEAPSGDRDIEPEVIDAARLAEEEERFTARRQASFTAAAIARDGAMAGFTMLVAHRDRPRVDQWDTLVLTEHRGRRLGLALKVANLRAFLDSGLPVERVNTWNATTNTPMIAINDQLGFRAVKFTGEFQGPIPG